MSDLISRHAAIEKAIEKSNVEGAYGYMDTKSIEDMLEDLPSAQPKKGKWIGADYDGDIGLYMCDQCGKFAMMKSDFCPNCGAEMRRQQDG